MKITANKQIYKKNGTLLVFTLLASIAAAVQYAFRINSVFIDITVFNGFSAVLMGLSVVTALTLLVLTVLKCNGIEKNGKKVCENRAFSCIAILAECFAVFFVIFNLGNLIGAGEETTPVMLKMLAKGMPLFGFLRGCIFAVPLPRHPKRCFQKVHCRRFGTWGAVSYTHLTLPTKA